MARLKLPCDRLPAWTLDLKNAKIRVNAISPGMVPTPGYDQFGFGEESEKNLWSQAKNIPLGRVGTPTRSPKLLSFSLPMTAALSTALSYSSMVAWHNLNGCCVKSSQ